MWIDLPPVTSAEIWSEFQKPLSQEVVSVWFCKSPDFQKQFDELQTQTKEKTAKLQEEMQYSEKQKEVLRKIYCSLWEENPELKSAIETQSVKVFEVPNRDLVAVSIDWKNVDYLYDLEGKEYFNFEWRRNNEIKYTLFLKNLEKIWFEETKNNWIYELVKNWTIIKQFSDESLNWYTEVAELTQKVIQALDYFIENNKK